MASETKADLKVYLHPAERLLNFLHKTDLYIRKRKGDDAFSQGKRVFDQLVPFFRKLQQEQERDRAEAIRAAEIRGATWALDAAQNIVTDDYIDAEDISVELTEMFADVQALDPAAIIEAAQREETERGE